MCAGSRHILSVQSGNRPAGRSDVHHVSNVSHRQPRRSGERPGRATGRALSLQACYTVHSSKDSPDSPGFPPGRPSEWAAAPHAAAVPLPCHSFSLVTTRILSRPTFVARSRATARSAMALTRGRAGPKTMQTAMSGSGASAHVAIVGSTSSREGRSSSTSAGDAVAVRRAFGAGAVPFRSFR